MYSGGRLAGRAEDGFTPNSAVGVAPGGKLAGRTSCDGGYCAADTGSAVES